jgi:hypothetical protein
MSKRKPAVLLPIAVLCVMLFGHNAGIGNTTPTRAKFDVHGAVDVTRAIFGGESSGISPQTY